MRVVEVGAIFGGAGDIVDVRQILAIGIGSLHQKAVREVLAQGDLQAVVVGAAIERGALQTYRLIAKIGNAQGHVVQGVAGLTIDWIAGSSQFRGVVIVVLIDQVEFRPSLPTPFRARKFW